MIITTEEIMDVVEEVLEIHPSEYDALKIKIDELVKSKKQNTSTYKPLPRIKDEWGNTDWRDTGEMGG